MIPTWEVHRGWGMAHHARSWVYRPRDREELQAALEDASSRNLTVALRGAGSSYGDAALNEGGALILTDQLHRVLDFDPEGGRVRVECGLTLGHLWRQVLPRGWWLPVVPGTQEVTVGGALAMNIHGKNQFVKGSVGEHVEALTCLRGDGSMEQVVGEADPTRLREIVGAQGLNGAIVDATLRLQRVHAGWVEVEARSTGSLVQTLSVFEEKLAAVDYAVGWIDCLAPEARAGRGLLHFARHLPPDHPRALEGMTVEEQRLPSRVAGLLPRSEMWRLLQPFAHDPGMRWVNLGRYLSGRLRDRRTSLETLSSFHFLLDQMPGWKRLYAPHGLIQYQLFVPLYNAGDVFREALRLQRQLGVHSYLGVLKRHRADAFAATYSLDGYSLALDFPVNVRRLDRLRRLCRSLNELCAQAGGRVYAAKDGVSVGVLPSRRDPLFSSNLVRRWEQGPAPVP